MTVREELIARITAAITIGFIVMTILVACAPSTMDMPAPVPPASWP